MSTSGILCPRCGTRIATITKGGVIRFLPGTIVERLFAQYSLVRCQCGQERKVRYPSKQAA